MSKLICDICGTSYSASEDKCPTCGYARAMLESAYDEEMAQVTRERVRGGRFSKKNVHKRMKHQPEQESVPAAPEQAVPQPEADMAAELGAAYAAASARTAEGAERKDTVLPLVLPADEEAMAGEPAEEPEQETAVLPLVLPADEEAMEEEPAEEIEESGTVLPLVLPDDGIADDEEPQAPAQKKKAIPLVWIVAGAALLLCLIFLLNRCSQPGPVMPEQTLATTEATEAVTDVPTQAATEAPTDLPTEAPTDPPTEPPTEAPTEAPTAPPTEPPTEAPTKPLLDVKLELNYYDLTFTSTGQATRLKANIIPAEDITWISDDPAIATVSETGLIIPVSGGRTTIRAVYGDQEAVVKVHCSIR